MIEQTVCIALLVVEFNGLTWSH